MAYLKGVCHASFSTIRRFFQDVLNTMGDGFEPTSSAQSHTWALDNLGNWSAGANQDSFRLFTEPAGAVDGIFNAGDTPLLRHHHAVTQQNEIATRWVGQAGGGPVPESFAYEAAGNLILDADHYYAYDSFNRVAAIYERGSVARDAEGEWTGQLGACLTRYTYDALGRRVKTHRSPDQPGQRLQPYHGCDRITQERQDGLNVCRVHRADRVGFRRSGSTGPQGFDGFQGVQDVRR